MMQCAYCGIPFFPSFFSYPASYHCQCGAIYVLSATTVNSTVSINFSSDTPIACPGSRTEVPQAFYDAFEGEV